MLAHPTHASMSVEDYLAFERESQAKHEYVDGHLYAMAGGTPTHGVITVNVTTAIRVHLRGGPCRVYSSDVRVQLTSTRYVYPDMSVGCDPRDRVPAGVEQEGISYPVLVVEVLSPSTEAYDRGDKFALYRGSDTLRQYVLVNTRRVGVEVYTRASDDTWLYQAYGPDQELDLQSIGLRCPIAVFYEDVDVPDVALLPDPRDEHPT
jgi:Uma2 family endonuclease